MALFLTVPDPFDAGDPPPTFEAYATIIGFHCDFAQTQMTVALSTNKSRQARIEDRLAVSQLKIIAPKHDILDEDGNVIQKGFATLIAENKPLFDQVAALIYEYVVSVPAVQELNPQPAPPLDD